MYYCWNWNWKQPDKSPLDFAMFSLFLVHVVCVCVCHVFVYDSLDLCLLAWFIAPRPRIFCHPLSSLNSFSIAASSSLCELFRTRPNALSFIASFFHLFISKTMYALVFFCPSFSHSHSFSLNCHYYWCHCLCCSCCCCKCLFRLAACTLYSTIFYAFV